MRRPNHASRFEGIAKTKLQASRASDTETLQSQVNKAAKKRLSLSWLEILHGRHFILAPDVSVLFRPHPQVIGRLCPSSSCVALLELRCAGPTQPARRIPQSSDREQPAFRGGTAP